MKNLILIFCLTLISQSVFSAQYLINGVPEYKWWVGCAPTSGAMIIGYWDSHGYPNLVGPDISGGYGALEEPLGNGSDVNDAVKRANAINSFTGSAGHIDKFWGVDTAVVHTPDSIADYMHTSDDSVVGLGPASNGSSSSLYMDVGLEDFANRTGDYSFSSSQSWIPSMGGTLDWNYVKSILSTGSPMMLGLLLNNGWGGHAVTIYGYKDGADAVGIFSAASEWFAVYDTWKDGLGHPGTPDNAIIDGGVEWWPWDTFGAGVGPELGSYQVQVAFQYTAGGGGGGGVPEPETIFMAIAGVLLIFLL